MLEYNGVADPSRAQTPQKRVQYFDTIYKIVFLDFNSLWTVHQKEKFVQSVVFWGSKI